MAPLNKMLKESQGVEFKRVRDNLHLKFDVITEWEPWGICEVCGRPQGQGRRRKKGFCRLKITPKFKNVLQMKSGLRKFCLYWIFLEDIY